MGVKDLFSDLITNMKYWGENIKKLYDVFEDFSNVIDEELDKVYKYNFIDECSSDKLNDRFKWIIPQGDLESDVYRSVLKAVINIMIRGFDIKNLKELLDIFSDNYEIYENKNSGNYLGEDVKVSWILGESILGNGTILGESVISFNFVEIVFKNFNMNYRSDLERILLKIKPIWQKYLIVYDINNVEFLENWSYIYGGHIDKYERVILENNSTIGAHGSQFKTNGLQNNILDNNAYYLVQANSNIYNNYFLRGFYTGSLEENFFNFVRIYKIVDESDNDVIADNDDIDKWILEARFYDNDGSGNRELKSSYRIKPKRDLLYDFYSNILYLNSDYLTEPIIFSEDEKIIIWYYTYDGEYVKDEINIVAGSYTLNDLRNYLNYYFKYTFVEILKDESGDRLHFVKGVGLKNIKRMRGVCNNLGLNYEKVYTIKELVNEVGIMFLNWKGDSSDDVKYYIKEVLFMKRDYISYNDLIKEDLL